MPLTSCVTLAKCLNLSVSQFPSLQNGANNGHLPYTAVRIKLVNVHKELRSVPGTKKHSNGNYCDDNFYAVLVTLQVTVH